MKRISIPLLALVLLAPVSGWTDEIPPPHDPRASAAVMTAGASFFIKGMADRASGASDRCAAALAIARGQEVEAQ